MPKWKPKRKPAPAAEPKPEAAQPSKLMDFPSGNVGDFAGKNIFGHSKAQSTWWAEQGVKA